MKHTKLRDYFPLLKTKKEIMEIIEGNKRLKSTFYSWSERARTEFIDFCTGQRGIKVLYDSFFKEVFNPEYAPERLNALLSVILGMKVKIIKVLPLDSTRMGDETALVTMDIIVELEDKSIVNIEMQKIGFYFPGERSACYSSDLVLRQYKRIREELDRKTIPGKFTYNMIKPVYTIVFFEQSPEAFFQYPDNYIHFFSQQSDTGLVLELVQRFVFISLDIFNKVSHNEDSDLNAWLTFLSSDDPEIIMDLIEKRPEFKPLYDTLFGLCLNVEGVMDRFSEELYELDRNTEQFMVDDMTKKIAKLEQEVSKIEETIAERDNEIAAKDNELAAKDNEIAAKDNELAAKDNELAAKDNELAANAEIIAKLQARIKELESK